MHTYIHIWSSCCYYSKFLILEWKVLGFRKSMYLGIQLDYRHTSVLLGSLWNSFPPHKAVTSLAPSRRDLALLNCICGCTAKSMVASGVSQSLLISTCTFKSPYTSILPTPPNSQVCSSPICFLPPALHCPKNPLSCSLIALATSVHCIFSPLWTLWMPLDILSLIKTTP